MFKSLILPLFPKVQLEKWELWLISAAGLTGFALEDGGLYIEFLVKEEKKQAMEKW